MGSRGPQTLRTPSTGISKHAMLPRREGLIRGLVGPDELPDASPLVAMLISILLVAAGALPMVLFPWIFKPLDRKAAS